MPFQFTCEECGLQFTRKMKARPARFCSVACMNAPRPITLNDDGTASVHLTQGGIAIIDAEDIPLVEGHNWRSDSKGYAIYQTGGRKNRHTIYMHRVILGTPDSHQTDHEDRNKLNNRRYNLRPATSSQNRGNTGIWRTNTSGFRGVTWHKSREKWCASITTSSKFINLGRFDNIEEAAEAYDRAATEYFGEFATLNFPNNH